jgi:hypothetical protein
MPAWCWACSARTGPGRRRWFASCRPSALADRIVVIDHGRVVAEGTSAALKNSLGSDVLDITITEADRLDDAAVLMSPLGSGPVTLDHNRRIVSVAAAGAAQTVLAAGNSSMPGSSWRTSRSAAPPSMTCSCR